MSQCITSKNGNTDIPQTTTAIKAATSMAPGNTKRGQSVDDLALTASRPTWRDSLKAKKQKLKQRSLTFDHFYRYVCRCWNRYLLRGKKNSLSQQITHEFNFTFYWSVNLHIYTYRLKSDFGVFEPHFDWKDFDWISKKFLARFS